MKVLNRNVTLTERWEMNDWSGNFLNGWQGGGMTVASQREGGSCQVKNGLPDRVWPARCVCVRMRPSVIVYSFFASYHPCWTCECAPSSYLKDLPLWVQCHPWGEALCSHAGSRNMKRAPCSYLLFSGDTQILQCSICAPLHSWTSCT